jgi:hypothetical protein
MAPRASLSAGIVATVGIGWFAARARANRCPGHRLNGQLLEDVPGLSSGEALGQGLQGRLGGALGRVPVQPATRLPDGLDDLSSSIPLSRVRAGHDPASGLYGSASGHPGRTVSPSG